MQDEDKARESMMWLWRALLTAFLIGMGSIAYQSVQTLTRVTVELSELKAAVIGKFADLDERLRYLERLRYESQPRSEDHQ